MPPVRSWDPTPYPDPRSRQPYSSGGLIGGEFPPPVSSVWSVLISPGAGPTLCTAVSRRYAGPAVLSHLRWFFNVSNTGTAATGLGLYVSDDNGGQGNATYGTPVPRGAPVIRGTTVVPAAPTFNAVYPDLLWFNVLGVAAAHELPLRYLVPQSEFFLKACLAVPGAGSLEMHVLVDVMEAVDPMLIEAFL